MLTLESDEESITFVYPHAWLLSRSLFKATCRAMVGFLVLGINLILFEAILKSLHVAVTTRYVATSLLTGLSHQLLDPAFARLQTITAKRAIPTYRGSWWINFLLLDHLTNEVAGCAIVGGFQSLLALLDLDNAVLNTSILILSIPCTFFLWALCEDFIDRFIFCRSSEAEEHQNSQLGLCGQYRAAFGYSLSRLFSPTLWVYNVGSITIKVCTTYAVYWVGDILLCIWGRCGLVPEATPNELALIVFVKNVIFFEGFLFFGIRCPTAILKHLIPDN